MGGHWASLGRVIKPSFVFPNALHGRSVVDAVSKFLLTSFLVPCMFVQNPPPFLQLCNWVSCLRILGVMSVFGCLCATEGICKLSHEFGPAVGLFA